MPWPNDSNPLFGGQAGQPLSNQHLSEHQNIRTAVAGLNSRFGINPGPIFWFGASHEDLYNAYVLTGGTQPYPVCQNSDGLTWAALVNGYFGQNFGQRWVTGNPLGQCYAVSAASVSGSQTGGT